MKHLLLLPVLLSPPVFADDCISCDLLNQPYQTPAIVQQMLNEPPRNYGYQPPVPVVPIEPGSYYNSNQYGSTYINPRTGVYCQSNRYSSTCF